MNFMKMSLLSILIFFFGISMVIFGNSINNTVDNSFKKELVVDPQVRGTTGPVIQSATVVFGDEYLSADESDDKIKLEAVWNGYEDFYPDYKNPEANYKLTEGAAYSAAGGEVIYGETLLTGQVSLDHGKDDESFLFESSFVDTGYKHTVYTLKLLMNNNDFNFEENHEYTLNVWFTSSDPSPHNTWGVSERFVVFTTPSKSVIEFTAEAGKSTQKLNAVEINTSWAQADQISDDIYSIDEKLELTLITGKDEYTDNINIDIDTDTVTVEDLYSIDYGDWKIKGTYYNGVEVINLEISVVSFKPYSIGYDDKVVKSETVTENSILVEFLIINPGSQKFDVEFYSGEDYSDDNKLDSHLVKSSTNDEVPKIYEITGLDYNTEYDLYISIEQEGKSINGGYFGSFKTLDVYPWVTPLDIVLLVIILVEIAAVSSIYILLQRNQKQ